MEKSNNPSTRKKGIQLQSISQPSNSFDRQLLAGMPIACYTCDKDGYITYFNEAASQLWGHSPEIGKDRWCGSWKIYDLDGNLLPLDTSPMGLALKKGISIFGSEIIIETPDGLRRNVLPHPQPIFDSEGGVIGGYNILIDITERKKAENAVRESEARFRTIADTVPAMVWMTGSEKKRIFFNKAWTNFTGRTLDQELGDGWLENIHPDYREQTRKIYSESFEARVVYTTEIRMRRYDGEYRWMSVIGNPRYAPDGKFLGYTGACTDITEQKLASQVLEQKVIERTIDLVESEKRYQQMVQEIEDYAILLLNNEGIICNWNEGAEKIKGYTPEEIIGKHFRTFYSKEDQEKHLPEQLLAQAAREGRVAHEGWRVRKDGGLFWGSVVLTALHDDQNNLIGFSKVTRDLTERKKAEDELTSKAQELQKKNDELLQQSEFADTILNSSVDLITVYDTEQRFVTLNKKSEEILGIKQKDILGKKYTEVFPASTNSVTHKGITKALAGIPGHFLLNKAAYSDHSFEIFTVPLTHNNLVYAALVIVHDITELVNITEKLKETNSVLESKNQELERSNNELEQFAHIASHDLQEPLRKIQLFSGRLQEEVSSTTNEQVLKFIDKINNSSKRMSNLIKDVLDYSSLQQKGQRAEKTDLNNILKEVIADFDLIIEEKNAIIEYSTMPVLDAIPIQMNQLFNNLLSNSLKYSKKGVQPHIRIISRALTSEEIKTHNLPKGTYSKISITDNGIGFEQEYAEKIFVAFQRLHGKQEYDGTGIGLALCGKIVDLHHGIIYGESEVGNGASFHIILPTPSLQKNISATS